MDIDSLMLGIKNVGFEWTVRQSDIKDDEDKEKYWKLGYPVKFTKNEFEAEFDIDADKVYFCKSPSASFFYFNEETMASLALTPLLLMEDGELGGKITKEQVYTAIAEVEQVAQDGDYTRSLLSLTDKMKLECLEKIVSRDMPCKDLYKFFLDFYSDTDYGFSALSRDTINTILEHKTKEHEAETRNALAQFPDEIVVYRGGNSASSPYDEGFSWTTNINVANFFACRRGLGPAYIAKGKVKKTDVIEYLDTREEDEILVYPDKVYDVEVSELLDGEVLKGIVDRIAPMYHDYLDEMSGLVFATDSFEHGRSHEARVLFLSLALADQLNLPDEDRRALATAAIFHDVKRMNDSEDSSHGRDGRIYYERVTIDPDPFVSFLCEYHCLPDKEGEEAAQSMFPDQEAANRALILYRVFKDADALDRVRFGLRGLDMNQLRLDVSKKMSLVARLTLDNLRVDD